MQRYKVIPLQEYETFQKEKDNLNKTNELNEKLATLPKAALRKVLKLIQVLRSNELEIETSTGMVDSAPGFDSPFNILPFVLYLVRGKERPEQYDKFIHLIAEYQFPRGCLPSRVMKDVKKAKAKRD